MIRFLLLHRIEVTDRHPGLMLVLAILMICLGSTFDPAAPQ